MRKIILSLLLLCTTAVAANAQLLRADELESYAKERYGKKWVAAATNLGSELVLDKNNAITYTQIIEAPGKSKNQLYVLLNYWFTATFNDGNSVIQLNDKELGTIIAQGFVASIARHTGGSNHYDVSIKPIIKCDIKDGKIRVAYTVPFYTVVRVIGGGWLSAFGGQNTPPPTESYENWPLDTCFPFAAKDSHKKTSCKALIMAHAYSNVVMDKIEEIVKNGIAGNENDNW